MIDKTRAWKRWHIRSHNQEDAKMTHAQLAKQAIKAINLVHSDTHVSLETTLSSLTKLATLTQVLKESIQEDIDRQRLS